MEKLNLYKSGSTFLMYKHNGPRKLIETCYWNAGDTEKTCGMTGGYDCYSYVCG
jgi:hypothetical protein